MIGLGGSSTNDGGAGMLTALGLRVVDAAGRDIAPTPQGLTAMARAGRGWRSTRGSPSRRSRSCRTSTIRSAANEARPPSSGPQKGVRAEEVASIDATLGRYASLAERAIGTSAAERARGRRAAGGAGLRAAACWAARSGPAPRSSAGSGRSRRGACATRRWAFTGEGRTDRARRCWQGAVRRRASARARARRADHALPVGRRRCGRPAGARRRSSADCFALPSGPMALADCIAGAETLLAGSCGADRARLRAARGRAWHTAAPGPCGVRCWTQRRRQHAQDRRRAGGRRFPAHRASAAPDDRAARQFSINAASSRSGRRVTRRSRRVPSRRRAHPRAHRSSPPAARAREFRAVTDAGEDLDKLHASGAQQREHGGVLRRVLRHAKRFRTKHTSWLRGSRRAGSACAPIRRGRRAFASSAASCACASNGPNVSAPIGRHSQTESAPSRDIHPAASGSRVGVQRPRDCAAAAAAP